LCRFKALLVNKREGGSLSASLSTGWPALWLSHRACQANFTTSSVSNSLSFFSPVFHLWLAYWVTVTTACSVGVGPCGPCRGLCPRFLVFLLNRWLILLQASVIKCAAGARSASNYTIIVFK